MRLTRRELLELGAGFVLAGVVTLDPYIYDTEVCVMTDRSTTAAPTGFYAYYTRTAFSEHTSRISGEYADVIVNLGANGQFIFSREYSYRPVWIYDGGEQLVGHLATVAGDGPVDRNFDQRSQYSYARIVEDTDSQIVIHWRYFPDLSRLEPTDVVHELYTIHSGGFVIREFRQGTARIGDWEDPRNKIVQTFRLSEGGITDVKTAAPSSSPPPGPVVGNLALGPVVGSPAAWWRFDEAQGDVARDAISSNGQTIEGHKSLWKRGVSGTALGFDGYFSRIGVPQAEAPNLGSSFTIDVWVALGAYPWNSGPIIHHSTECGERGYYLGFDSLGRVLFVVNGIRITSPGPDPLNQWIHVVGAYGRGAMEIYVDGMESARSAASGAPDLPNTPFVIGMNNEDLEATDPVRSEHHYPFRFGIEGLIDEVKLYDRKLSPEEIRRSFESFDSGESVRGKPDIQPRVLPGMPGVASQFGATYVHLRYHDLWDNMWRVDPYADVVVKFEDMPTSYVYWRGTTHGVNMVTENNHWMSDQSVEIFCEEPPGGRPSLSEHMSDKEARFSHVRVLENTDARVVMHWRYAVADLFYQPCRPTDFVDEYHTIYPDGVLIRHVVYWTGVADYQDMQAFSNPGLTPLDVVNLQALSVADIDGRTADLTWSLPAGVPSLPFEASIEMLNFRSRWKVFAGFQGAGPKPWGGREQSPNAADPFAGPWNHWPVSRMVSDGRFAVDGDGRVNHFALAASNAAHLGTGSALYGFSEQDPSTQDISTVIPVVRAWRRSPTVSSVTGGTSDGYNIDQREYNFTLRGSSLSFSLDGSGDRPIMNPCFVIKDWGSNQQAVLEVNGSTIAPGSGFRQGVIRDTDGIQTLVVFVNYSATSVTDFRIQRLSE